MTFPLSPEEFAELQKRAGIPVDQFSGEVEQYKVRASWSYADGVLVVTILKKPWLMPEAFIIRRFSQWAGLPVPPQ